MEHLMGVFRKRNSVQPQSGEDAEHGTDVTKQQILQLHRTFTQADGLVVMEERKKAICDIGHLAWIRGCEVAKFASEKCFGSFASILQDSQHPVLHKPVIIAISQILQSNSSCQEHVKLSNIGSILVNMLTVISDTSSKNKEMCQWILHALYFICCPCCSTNDQLPLTQEEILILKEKVSYFENSDWSQWKTNAAEAIWKWCQHYT